MQGRLPIIASLGVGILAILALNLYVDGIRKELQPPMETVMVAARDLRAGKVLEASEIAAAQRPRNALPAMHIRWAERNLYLGQPLEVEVQQNDYVLASYFGGQAVSGTKPSERIDAAQDQRAFTMPVNNETSLERSIRPGDRVDLLLTYREAGQVGAGQAQPTANLVTTTLLENAYVLYTGRYGSRAGDYSSITFLLSADQAKLLVWAQKLGEISVLLRNPKDLRTAGRAAMVGDLGDLAALRTRELRIEEIVSKEQSAEAP